MGETLLSSPDPLNDTPTFHSPGKTRRSSRVRHSLPIQGSSPKKQTFELDVGNELSPQKIKVTVEAGDSDAENVYPGYTDVKSPTRSRAPKNRRMERTTTTTIPVKGLSDSEDETQDVATPKRGRGRPKKSSGTPVPAKKGGRAGTPTRKNGGRRKSIGDLVDGDDSDDVNFQIGKGVEIGRGKGGSRSRSRSTKGTSRKSTPASRETAYSDTLISSTTSKKGRGRRKTLLPEEVVVLEDESSRQSVERQESETPGALDEYNVNRTNPTSAYSTIRSTTTIGGNEPDITLAIFDPGNETPHRTGWSSPRVVEAPIPSSTMNRLNSYPSPSTSPEKSHFSQYEEESVAMVPAPPSDTDEHMGAEPYDNDYIDGQYGEDDEDVFGELREFDTILESEGFSMISVDSVPSLREHHSSPAIQPKDEVPSPIRNKSLLSVQDVDATGHNDSFSSIPDEVLEAATPGRKAQNRNLLSVQNPAVEDSFSSVAPDILEAATPARELTRRELSATKTAPVESYEDSFSAIPSAVLDAATPAAVRHPRSKSDRLSVPSTRFSVSPGNVSGSAALRLPTPEETPSPPGETTSKDEPAPTTKASSSRSAGQNSLQNDSSIVVSHMPSSPPSIAPRRYTYTAHLRQHRQLNPDITQTPSIVFSSPSLPPPKPAARGQPVLAPALGQSQRPTLSPIVRAGRALQDVVVPSSPRSRSQSLGSPFKSPAADKKSSSSAVRQSAPSPLQERRVGLLPKLDLNGELTGLSSQRRPWTSLNQQEDPFSSREPSKPRSPSPEDIQKYSLDLPEQRRYSDPRLSTIKNEVDSVRSDDAMSWQAEEEISLPEGTTSISNVAMPAVSSRGSLLKSERSENNAMTSEQRYAAEREAVRKQMISADPNNVIVIDSDDDDDNDGYGHDDEDFGLLLETLNSSSPAAQPPQELIKDAFEKPRRSKIPSPWRKNSKRLVYSDELSQLDSPISERVALAKGNTQDLTAGATSRPVTVRRIVTPVYSDETDPADLSGWQIPQKSNFKPRVRESTFDLSALLASPEKPLPKLTANSQRSLQQTSHSSQVSSTENTRGMTKSSETRSGEVTGFTPIPQKSGFNPRARADFSSSPIKQTSFAPTIFGGPMKVNTTQPPSRLPEPSSPISKPLRSSSPSRTNSLLALHTPLDQLSRSVCSEEEPHSSSLLSNEEKENQHKQNKTLKWTESLRLQSATEFVQAPLPMTSPTKSCLRSPLKTPSANYGSGNGSPSKAVTFVSSSPMPDSPVAPLSSTKWSKDHWRLLDSILQSWKPENQSSPSSSDSSGPSSGEGSRSEQPRKRRNSTRVISKLLGKKVSSQGESMRFEQWHLEAVDEFRGVVSGWEEKVVAMRVFACLVGEERRALGLVGSSAQDDWRDETK
jgi:serine/arginine repetitive matrix protein 2